MISLKGQDWQLKNGIDMVIELPTIYATSSSQFFATGAIKILNSINIIDTLCFGSECKNLDTLKNIVEVLVKNEEYILNKTKELMKSGNSFASSRSLALEEFFDENTLNEISKPNNILAIEYIKVIKKIGSNIVPFNIKREGVTHNDNMIKEENKFASATSIRNYIYNNDVNILQNVVPNETYNIINSSKYLSNEDLFNLLKYTTILNKDELNSFNGVIEGLENKILDAINISNTYDEFIHNIKSKRYTMATIKRMLISILLNITKEDFNTLINNEINYAHILSISERGKTLLSEISKKSNINLLTSLNDQIINNLGRIDKKSLKLDILSTNIYSSLLNEDINKDYTNKL